MSTTQVEIYNLALSHIGVTNFATAIGDTTTEAIVCSKHFDLCRDELLGMFDWRFARKRLTLTLLAADPNPEWAYEYTYPADCVVARRLIPQISTIYPEYEIGNNGTAVVIYSNEPDAVLEYTFRLTTVAMYPHLFVVALSYLLAVRIAVPLSRVGKILTSVYELYERSLSIAMASAENEGNRGIIREAEIITTREAG